MTYARSFFDGSRGGTRPSWLTDFCEFTYRMLVSGSYEPPGQFVPPPADASTSVASGPSALLTTGGVKIGPILYLDTTFTPSARSSGVKSIRSSSTNPCRVVVERLAARVERERLRRRVRTRPARRPSAPGALRSARAAAPSRDRTRT